MKYEDFIKLSCDQGTIFVFLKVFMVSKIPAKFSELDKYFLRKVGELNNEVEIHLKGTVDSFSYFFFFVSSVMESADLNEGTYK